MSSTKSAVIVTISILFCIGASALIGYFCSKQSIPADDEKGLFNFYHMFYNITFIVCLVIS